MISLIVALFIAIFDQLVKIAIVRHIKPIKTLVIVPNFLNFTYVENTGAAFGLLKNQRYFFIIISVVLIVAFFYFVIFHKISDKIFTAAVTLILGGGIGNFIDRIFLGYVIDYIDLAFFAPVCNLADFSICIGSFLLVFYIIFRYKCKDVGKKVFTEGKN